MNTFKQLFLQFSLVAAVGSSFLACDGEDGLNGQDGQDGQDFTPTETIFSNKSSLNPLVNINPNFSNVNAYSLISSTDVLSNGFRLVGAQDGAGFLKDGDEYIYVVNAEDDYSVSRIRFDQYMNPIQGEWLLNAGVADYARQCSGTMWEAAVHGGSQDLFLSASESISYDVKGIDLRLLQILD